MIDEMTETWECRRENFVVSADRARLDIDAIHGFLSGTYWAANIPRDLLERSIRHSMPFGIYETTDDGQPERLVGFARVITDYATFGYIADVFVLETHRGRGLAAFLMESIVAHPDLQGFRNWLLMTRDAQGLYAKAGFAVTNRAENIMERRWTSDYSDFSH